VRREALLDLLRRAIVSGRAAPNSRLPSRAELMARHRVSSITVQRAFDQLTEDGFVVPQGKRGTWVVEHPPHLYRYGLAFAGRPGKAAYWRGLDRALSQVAGDRAANEPWSFKQYFSATEAREMDLILEDIAAGRLACLISTYGSSAVVDRVRRQWPTFPLVEISASHKMPSSTVVLDLRSFFQEALDYLRARRRQRVAILTGVQYPDDVLRPVLAKDVRERGITVQPYWVQQIALTDPLTARSVMHLMMRANPSMRPNGVIIADDNLTEHALAGLADAGVHVPADVEIVAEANFPLPPSAGQPIHRVGFPASEILRACRALLDRQRRGDAARVPENITIAAVGVRCGRRLPAEAPPEECVRCL